VEDVGGSGDDVDDDDSSGDDIDDDDSNTPPQTQCG